MTEFRGGDRYTRDQVRNAVGLPPMKGGDWATGYARFADEVFIFCNIGTAGRTGHDYPNRWVDGGLDWFGNGSSAADQPLISAMVAGTVTPHVFWRGRDRAPFTYAGIGVAEGVWGEKPVEILWRFDGSPPAVAPASRPTDPAGGPEREAGFRHGPPPSFGLKRMLSEDGECPLYLMTLDGVVDALFPALTPKATNRSIIKVGISREPLRRQRELNAGFPKGAQAHWSIRDTRPYPTAGAAYDAEGLLLETLARTGRWISGEFAIVADPDLETLLHR